MSEEQPTRDQLEAAIAAQESLRAALGDATVDATIAILKGRLDQLSEGTRQRKLMTILFADVVNSTDLMRGRDPEETMTIMDAALTRLAEPISEHGGKVTRFMGDGFMAVFGLSKARENDPEMAVSAGLGVTRTARTLAAELQAMYGLEGLTVRVGLNTGLVVAGGVTEAGDTVMGDAVNLASRIESAARPGRVLISAATLQHVRGRFEVEDSGTIEAKGFPEPIPVFHVVGPRDPGTEEERGIEGLKIPMVGREEELAGLLGGVNSAAADGTVQVMTIVGEAGLGKSRLLHEFRARLDPEAHTVLEASARLETQGLPYFLVRNLLERRYDTGALHSASSVRDALVAGVTDDLDGDPDAEMKAHFIGHMIGFDFSDSPHVGSSLGNPQQIRSRAVMYLGHLISAISARRTVVAIVEDLHWADGDSLDVLDDLLTGLESCRVCFIGATRPELRTARSNWGSRQSHRWIPIEPLSAEQVGALASSALRKVTDVPAGLRDRLVDHAAGNPYYLEETVRMLIGDGVIVTTGDAWRIDLDRIPDLRIPATLTGVIQARLDALSATERRTLQQASVIGRIFWEAVVRQLAADARQAAGLEVAISELGAKEMIHERATSTFAGTAEFAFHHEILRAVAYEGVLLDERRAYHSSVADWLLLHRGDRAVDLTGLIAGHLRRANRTVEALDCYAEAAEEALAAYAVEAADAYFEQALELVQAEDTDRRFSLLLGRESTLEMRVQPSKRRVVLDQLEDLAQGNPERSAIVSERQAWFHFLVGDSAASQAHAQAAVQAAVAAANPSLEALARIALVWSTWTTNDPIDARREAECALASARAGTDEAAVASAHNTLGLLAAHQRSYSDARHPLNINLGWARERGDLQWEAKTLNNLAVIEIRLGDYNTARTHLERFHQIAEEVGDRLSTGTALTNLAWLFTSSGDWAAGKRCAIDALAVKRQIGHTDAVAESLMWLGHAELGLSNLEAAHAAYSEALDLRREIGQEALAMGARAGIAATALRAGDLELALSHARAVVEYLDGGGSLQGAWEPFHIRLRCAEVLRAAGDPAADGVLSSARTILLADADRITGEADRRTFLENVPWHREILRLSAPGT